MRNAKIGEYKEIGEQKKDMLKLEIGIKIKKSLKKQWNVKRYENNKGLIKLKIKREKE